MQWLFRPSFRSTDYQGLPTSIVEDGEDGAASQEDLHETDAATGRGLKSCQAGPDNPNVDW